MIAWNGTSNGSFSVTSTYMSLCESSSSIPRAGFEAVWGWPGPKRIRITLWKVLRYALLTNDQRVRRGMTLNPHCPHCTGIVESMDHVFRSCSFAQQVWSLVWKGVQQLGMQAVDFHDWLIGALPQRSVQELVS